MAKYQIKKSIVEIILDNKIKIFAGLLVLALLVVVGSVFLLPRGHIVYQVYAFEHISSRVNLDNLLYLRSLETKGDYFIGYTRNRHLYILKKDMEIVAEKETGEIHYLTVIEQKTSSTKKGIEKNLIVTVEEEGGNVVVVLYEIEHTPYEYVIGDKQASEEYSMQLKAEGIETELSAPGIHKIKYPYSLKVLDTYLVGNIVGKGNYINALFSPTGWGLVIVNSNVIGIRLEKGKLRVMHITPLPFNVEKGRLDIYNGIPLFKARGVFTTHLTDKSLEYMVTPTVVLRKIVENNEQPAWLHRWWLTPTHVVYYDIQGQPVYKIPLSNKFFTGDKEDINLLQRIETRNMLVLYYSFYTNDYTYTTRYFVYRLGKEPFVFELLSDNIYLLSEEYMKIGEIIYQIKNKEIVPLSAGVRSNTADLKKGIVLYAPYITPPGDMYTHNFVDAASLYQDDKGKMYIYHLTHTRAGVNAIMKVEVYNLSQGTATSYMLGALPWNYYSWPEASIQVLSASTVAIYLPHISAGYTYIFKHLGKGTSIMMSNIKYRYHKGMLLIVDKTTWALWSIREAIPRLIIRKELKKQNNNAPFAAQGVIDYTVYCVGDKTLLAIGYPSFVELYLIDIQKKKVIKQYNVNHSVLAVQLQGTKPYILKGNGQLYELQIDKEKIKTRRVYTFNITAHGKIFRVGKHVLFAEIAAYPYFVTQKEIPVKIPSMIRLLPTEYSRVVLLLEDGGAVKIVNKEQQPEQLALFTLFRPLQYAYTDSIPLRLYYSKVLKVTPTYVILKSIKGDRLDFYKIKSYKEIRYKRRQKK